MQKVMALEENDIKLRVLLVDLICLVGMLTILSAVLKAASFESAEWVIAAYPLAVSSTALMQLLVLFLRWAYGYTKGVGGATPWGKLDAVSVIIWSVGCFLALCCIAILIADPVTTRMPFSVLMNSSVAAIVGAAAIVDLLLKVRKDYRDWKRVEFHGIFVWNFREFVEERFKAVQEKGYADF